MTKHLPLALAAALLVTTTQAQEWTGAVSSDWNNAANWSDWPLGGEDITIDPANYAGVAASPVIGAASVFTPDRMFVQNGAELSIGAGLTVSDRFIIADDAQVVMSAGTLVTDRLIMELGGGFTLEAGTIATGRLVLGDDGEGHSTYTQQGGTVSVTGEFGFDCAVGPSAPVITINGGSVVSSAEAIWLGVSPASGAGVLALNGGTLTLPGMANSVGSTIDMRVRQTDGTLTVNGAVIDLAHTTDSLVMTGGLCVLDAAVVLRNDGVVHATAGTLRIDALAELRGVGSYRFQDVDITTGATLRHTAPEEIAVGGDWSNAGTFDPDGNTVAFVSAGTQAVEATPFFGLRMANSGPGVRLAGSSTVAGALTLDQGLVNFAPGADLTVLHGATASSGSAESHVNGPLRKVGNEAFVFPIGADGQWRRIGIGAVNDQDTEFTAEFLPTAPASTSSLADGMAGVSTLEHWRLERAVTNEGTEVQLFWEDAATSAVNDCDALVVAHWNGSAWAGSVSTTTGSCAGNAAGTVRSDTDVPYYSFFTFGTSDGTIGVEEHAGPALLAPYPQPADRGTWLSLPNGTRTIAVYDLTGKRIGTYPMQAHTDRYYLPTAELPTGLYLVQATGKEQVLATGRVVVGH